MLEEFSLNAEMLLRGRKFKLVVESMHQPLRKKYGLKQIDLDILGFFNVWPNSRATDICQTLLLNKGQVSKSLEELCKAGYLGQKNVQEDRRAVYYELLEKGKPLSQEVFKISIGVRDRLLSGITEEEILFLKKICSRIAGNLDSFNVDDSFVKAVINDESNAGSSYMHPELLEDENN